MNLRLLPSVPILLCCLLVSSCASRSPAPPPPDTPAGRLASIAYLPYFGASIDITEQQLRAKDWADMWRDVYPSTRWILSQETAKQIADAWLSDSWINAEKTYLQLGSLPTSLVKQLCGAIAADGLLQMAVTGVQAGGVVNSWFRPWFLQSGGPPSTARISAVLYRCSDSAVLWQKSTDLSWQTNYSHSQMVDYVQRSLGYHIPK